MSIRVSARRASFGDGEKSALALVPAKLLLEAGVELSNVDEQSGARAPFQDGAVQGLEELLALVEAIAREGHAARSPVEQFGNDDSGVLGEARSGVATRPNELQPLGSAAGAFGEDCVEYAEQRWPVQRGKGLECLVQVRIAGG